MRARPVSARPRRQRGAALLTAMIIVTLVATLAAAMVWQQWRAVQVETAERARTQAAWILSGALDFARLILREDQKNGSVTALTEPWATPLAEARLSTFLAADTSNVDDGPEAFLSGSISDAQARYNVMNLLASNKIDPVQLQTLERICQNAGLDVSIAQRIATGLLGATSTSTTAAAPLLPQTVAQLSWLGIDPDSLQTLQPYIVVLPIGTNVNVNTASKEVLAAVLNIDPSTAGRMVQIAQVTPFKDTTSFATQLGSVPLSSAQIDTKSSYFEIRGRLRLADHVLVERTILRRNPDRTSTVIERERIASLDRAGA
jgi:general secretion pathway protein K